MKVNKINIDNKRNVVISEASPLNTGKPFAISSRTISSLISKAI